MGNRSIPINCQSTKGVVTMEGCRGTVAAPSFSWYIACCLLLLFLISPGTCTSTPDTSTVEMSQMPLNFEYHNYIVMTEYLKEVANKYPHLTRLESIGKSVQERDLWTLMVSSQQDDQTLPLGTPNVKIVGNIHGNEVLGREVILHMIEYLVTNYNTNSTIAELLNTTRIYFLPSMNPDGFEEATEGACRGTSGRMNAKKVDLNRSFPDHFRENHLKEMQPETKAVIEWMERVPFILSASLHGGALVANYPFENLPEDVPLAMFKESLSPDDDVFKHLALTYSRAHPRMHLATQCNGKWPIFMDGITNGAAWYSITGGMQDYNYVWHGCMEITLEISCCKFPPSEELLGLWNENKEALLIYAMEAHKGVKGVVLDARSQRPITNARLKIMDRDMTFNSSSRGEYWRLLLPRSRRYRIEALAEGYRREVVDFRVTSAERVKWIEIQMRRRHDVNPAVKTAKAIESMEALNGKKSPTQATATLNSTELMKDGGTSQELRSTSTELPSIDSSLLNPSAIAMDYSNQTELQNMRAQKSIHNTMVSSGWVHTVMQSACLSAILFLTFVH